jgi:hypothetical protein
MNQKTKNVIAGTLMAGLGVAGGIAIDAQEKPKPEVQEQVVTDPGFQAKKVKDIAPSRTLTKEQKELGYKKRHGEIVLPVSKDDLITVKGTFTDKQETIEQRMEHLQVVMADALSNSDLQMSFYDKAKAEYEQLLTIYNQ